MRLVAVIVVTVAARRAVVSLDAVEERLRVYEGECFTFRAPSAWWAYSWCHRRSVKQFHDWPGHKLVEYSLGSFKGSGPTLTHSFTEGDACGPGRRRATVDFACCKNESHGPREGRGYGHERRFEPIWIKQVREYAACQYAVTVCTRAIACGETAVGSDGLAEMSTASREAYKEATRRVFGEAYDAYMKYAFPAGELRPISCRGAMFQLVELPLVTLVDALDTLAVMGNASEFKRAVRLVCDAFVDGFDFDANVSVFETNIRVLGGLLSAHMLAADEDLGLYDEYDGALLNLAVDLGTRLLPAFDTATGIPYGTVNLRYGVPPLETAVASLAGGGSVSLEFAVLSALSGNPVFGDKGRQAARGLFERRSRGRGLLGKHVNVQTGKWVEALSGIGSNSDSFYEYLAKMYALFGDDDDWAMFLETYEAVVTYATNGDWYSDVDMYSGKPRRHHFENLQAFWPGVQAGAGDVHSASRSLNAFWLVFSDWAGLPEDFDYQAMQLFAASKPSLRLPLRPELVESTYVLFRATRHPSWLWAAAHALEAIEIVHKAPCGYATAKSAATHHIDDEMPSFFLAETLKYLYLIFDDANLVHNKSRDFVFSTEAHVFSGVAVRRALQDAHPTRKIDSGAAAKPLRSWFADTFWRRFKQRREPAKHQSLRLPVNVFSEEAALRRCRRLEWWEAPTYDPDFADALDDAPTHKWRRRRPEDRFFFSVPLNRHRCPVDGAALDTATTEDQLDEDTQTQQNVVTHAAVEGIGFFRIEVFSDGFHVKNEQSSEAIEISNVGSAVVASSTLGDDAAVVAVGMDNLEIACEVVVDADDDGLRIPCTVAAFGRAANLPRVEGAGLRVVNRPLVIADPPNDRGCDPPPFCKGSVLVVRRGACLFEDKARSAEAAAAVAVIVINGPGPGPHRFIMANSSNASSGDSDTKILAVMISHDDGAKLDALRTETMATTISVVKRQLPVDSPVRLTVAKHALSVVGRGNWGVALTSKPDHPDEWQLSIVKVPSNGFLPPCDLPAEPTLDAHFDDARHSTSLFSNAAFFLAAATQVRRCACPNQRLLMPIGDSSKESLSFRRWTDDGFVPAPPRRSRR